MSGREPAGRRVRWQDEPVSLTKGRLLALVLFGAGLLAPLAVAAAIGLTLIFDEPPAALLIAFGLILVARAAVLAARDAHLQVRRRRRLRRLRDRRAGT